MNIDISFDNSGQLLTAIDNSLEVLKNNAVQWILLLKMRYFKKTCSLRIFAICLVESQTNFRTLTHDWHRNKKKTAQLKTKPWTLRLPSKVYVIVFAFYMIDETFKKKWKRKHFIKCWFWICAWYGSFSGQVRSKCFAIRYLFIFLLSSKIV